MDKTKTIKYLDLFTGIGGFTLGIEQAYEICNANRSAERGVKENQKGNEGQGLLTSEGKDTRSEKGRSSECPTNFADERPLCIGFSEIDKYATKIYQSHYPEHKNYGDITKIIAEDLPDFDLLVGGFPCQSFSIAGKRGGFNDTRGTLFFDVARILKAKHPRNFILENVKGLLSHDTGRTFRTIITTLDGLGYDLQWQVLNSKNFGVPQNRERVYIVGHLRGKSRPKVFPITEGSTGNLKYCGGVISTREQWLKDGKHNSRNFSQGQRIYDTGGISQCLAGQAGGQGGKTGLYQMPYIQNPKMLNYKKDYENSVAITATSYKEPPVVNSIRRLTPTECARLQGFPDDWHKIDGISDTQAYKCYGNAVTVNVVKEVVTRLLTPNGD